MPRPPNAIGSSATFRRACDSAHGLVVPMATVSLFFDPVFRDGAFTANDPSVRAYAMQKTMRAMDIGAELGRENLRAVGRARGHGDRRLPAADEAVKRLREAVNYLCEYSLDRKYGYRFALEAKPNEPRGDIYMATTGTLPRVHPDADHPEMVGVNPEVAHETDGRPEFPARRRAGVGSGQAVPHRSERSDDRPLRPGFSFWRRRISRPRSGSVKFLEDVGYDGPRHFDAHAYRTEDYEGVKDFARGCMRTYLILKARAAQWNADKEIQALIARSHQPGQRSPSPGCYSAESRDTLLAHDFDRATIAKRGLNYERLDQLTMEVILGAR